MDGSGLEDGIGVVAVIYKKGISQPLKHLKAYLGPSTLHNTYEGEAVGGILVIWLIQGTAGTDFKNVSLYIDNQALITTSVSPKASPGQYLVWAFSQAANNTTTKLRIYWISSHSEVKGNEHVDSLAKEAAAGKASCRTDLPPLLRKTLPASASAIKQEHLAHLNRKWKSAWLSSPRERRLKEIDSTLPFSKFWQRQYDLTREQASLLMQVRSGHIPLNSYLFRIGKADSKYCSKCNDGPEVESVNHFIFECAAYANQRWTLTRIIGYDNLNLHDIMLTMKNMKALALFIDKTGRFKS